LAKWAVDVPYLDEWDVLRSSELPTGLAWKWLWAPHNEHRILLTHLEVLGLYHLTGWNLVVQQLANYAFYVAAVILLGWCAHRRLPSVPRWVWAAFLLFLLSPRLGESMLWGFQSQWHFAWAFAVAAGMAIFTPRPSIGCSLLAAACASLAIVSLAGGLVMVLLIASVYLAYRGLVVAELRQSSACARDIALFVLPCALVSAYWAHGYRLPLQTWPSTPPWSVGFWSYYLNLVSSGFGIDTVSMPLGMLCLALVMTPLAFVSLGRPRRRDGTFWAVAALAVSVLGVLGTITMARAAHPDAASWLKGARYAEIAQLLIPVTVFGWALLLDDRPVAQRATLLCLWLFCVVAFRDNWSYQRYYRWEHDRRLRGLVCVHRYYEADGPSLCPDLYPWDLKEQLDNAKLLHVSFYQGLSRR